ncbi:ABC transporter permease [Tessaracoccus sp. OS52]|uniref:ABC transporter permease n=1 Tax=Tessaracoccus sp. OS52 TaxID=2886691 RepID=UPI001D0F9921|nr:ABC transporter permease [Tessaracoccus sp. OS52]MCC2591860.1 ABC transporter permease [Tessaracoccus sp. OS52]
MANRTLVKPSLAGEEATWNRPGPSRRLRLPEATALIGFLLVELMFFSFASPYFLSWTNFVNILTTLSVTGILAAGATILLIGGQFDLSVGSGVAWVGVVLAVTAPIVGLPWAIILGVLAGILVGALNGIIVTGIGVNALITTLGSMAIFRGLTLSVGQGQSIGIPGFDWALIRPFLGIPLPVMVFAVVAIGVHFLLNNTVYGRSIYAVGSNSSAARLVGINNRRNLFIAFLISGACMAIAGLSTASQLGSTSGTTGTGLEMAAITAVILGGASLGGGVGSMGGTLLGLLIVALLGNGMTLMNINSSWQQVATGALLILAVSLDVLRQRMSKR